MERFEFFGVGRIVFGRGQFARVGELAGTLGRNPLAAFGAVFGMLALNGLPMPYHPVFNVRRFDQASRDKFFLVIQARDPKFNLDEVRDFFDRHNPREIVDVPW